MTDFAQRLAALSPEQRKLLTSRLARQELGRVEVAPIPRRATAEPAPLSFAQQRLWLLDQLEPGGSAYRLPMILRLNGALDLGALREALDVVVARHDALRTTFPLAEGMPVQAVAPPTTGTLRVEDLTGAPDPGREAVVRQRLREEARTGFDLARGPLFRALLLRLAPEEHVLLLAMHHIISDGWSLSVLFRELGLSYRALLEGADPSLPELPIQYADYAIWQRQRLQGAALRREVEYWRGRLAGAAPALDLVTDHPRPLQQAHRGAKETVVLPGSVQAGLREVSRRGDASLFMTLLAAFKSLLSRYSAQEDLVVGVPVAGRTRSETESLVGFFVNSLAIRTDLAGDPSFPELLARVREQSLGAYAHQELPFEKLVEELQPERDLSRTPVFQVFFNMLNAPGGRIDFPGLKVERVASTGGAAKFDLTLYASERHQGLKLTLAYDVSLFEPSTAAAMLSHYRELLEGIAEKPDRPLSAFRLHALPGAAANRREAPAQERAETSVPGRFAEVVRLGPGRLAVETRAHRWTYQELDLGADRVARAVGARQSSAPGPVALLLDHGAPMVAAILGVLRSGSAYVPLDPAHPPARLAYQLADAGVEVLVTDGPNRELARRLDGGALTLVEVDRLTDGRNGRQPARSEPRSLAYLLYTSGTTGQPKAVVQSHRNLVHWADTYARSIRLGAGDRVSLLSSYGFDAAVMDIFGALLTGATLCPIDPRGAPPELIVEEIRERDVTVLHATPTLYRYLLGALQEGESLAPGIRMVVLGGEETTRHDVALFRAHFPADCRLVNGLGPTECTLALQYHMDKHTPLPRHAVPIGFPVEGAEVLLLDSGGRETDVLGEIAIRSEHLALEYWRSPQLTRSAFPPEHAVGARRLFRTGDLGRRLPDGALEFRGRQNRQLKLRGHRIEPGEIESVLMEHPAVGESVVVLRDDLPAGPGLVAYVTGTAAPESRALRTHCQGRLPEYMVPQAFVPIPRLPLLPNGKLDRSRLPKPEDAAVAVGGSNEPPSSPTEHRLAAIWGAVLQRQTVGRQDNFFALGGHSLLAAQVLSRVRQEFEIELPLRALFEAPLLAGLAERIEQAGLTQSTALIPSLVRQPRQPATTPPGLGAARPEAG